MEITQLPRVNLSLRERLDREIELLEQAGYVQVEKEARAGPIVMQLGNVLLVNNCEDKWSVASAILDSGQEKL